MLSHPIINIIGGGFAGIECALKLAGHGIKVHMFNSPCDYSCNCKFCRGEKEDQKEMLQNKLLIQELNYLGSPLIREETRLREQNYTGCCATKILEYGKNLVKNNRYIEYFDICISELNPREINVIATGPCTDEKLFNYLIKKFGSMRCFNKENESPIVRDIDESLLKEKKGDKEYLYLPLEYDEYIRFVNSVIKVLNRLSQDKRKNFYQNTIENLVMLGKDALKDFAMKPIYLEGLEHRPYAVLTLHKEKEGFKLKRIFSNFDKDSQIEILHSIKALQNAEIINQGEVKNRIYINSKYMINEFNQSVQDKNIFFAGGILGLNSYYDCIASGLITGLNIYKYYNGKNMILLPQSSMIGSLPEKLKLQGRGKDSLSYEIKDNEKGLNQLFVEKFYKMSEESIMKFKEEYIYGKYV